MATRHIKPLRQETVEALAWILGKSSAAAKALQCAAERRAAGERVAFYEGIERGHRYIFVGPPIPE